MKSLRGNSMSTLLNVSCVEPGQAKNIMEDSGLTSGIQPKGTPVCQSNYSKHKQRRLINPHINYHDDDQDSTSVTGRKLNDYQEEIYNYSFINVVPSRPPSFQRISSSINRPQSVPPPGIPPSVPTLQSSGPVSFIRQPNVVTGIL